MDEEPVDTGSWEVIQAALYRAIGLLRDKAVEEQDHELVALCEHLVVEPGIESEGVVEVYKA